MYSNAKRFVKLKHTEIIPWIIMVAVVRKSIMSCFSSFCDEELKQNILIDMIMIVVYGFFLLQTNMNIFYIPLFAFQAPLSLQPVKCIS